MESKGHFRKRSELPRTRLLSDRYFSDKLKKKRSASLTNESSFSKAPSELFSSSLKLGPDLNSICNLIEKDFSMIRKEEIPLYQSFVAIVDPEFIKHLPSISLNNLKTHLKSPGFLRKVQTFTVVSSRSASLLSSLDVSLKFYLNISKALYGYNLLKSVSSFIESLYKQCKVPFKPIKNIEYFQSLQSPSHYCDSRYLEKLFNADPIFETTKDDEEGLKTTLGDDRDYENLLDSDQSPILKTEPDSRSNLVSLFFKNNASKNPYVESCKNQRKLEENRPEKWHKYLNESVYLKKLGSSFVKFVTNKGKIWEEEADLVTWVYKNKSELIEEFLTENRLEAEGISELKHQAMIKHLGDKKTLRELFKGL